MQSVRSYIRTQGMACAVINALLNPAIAWLGNRQMAFVPQRHHRGYRRDVHRPIAAGVAVRHTGIVRAEPMTTYRNDRGQEIGRAEKRGNTTIFYDAKGRRTGRAERRGSETIYFDASGRQIGTARPR
jgi:YD repeat-containing protein